jgi:hypothetical protein
MHGRLVFVFPRETRRLLEVACNIENQDAAEWHRLIFTGAQEILKIELHPAVSPPKSIG